MLIWQCSQTYVDWKYQRDDVKKGKGQRVENLKLGGKNMKEEWKDKKEQGGKSEPAETTRTVWSWEEVEVILQYT